jgi:hypothetical protein
MILTAMMASMARQRMGSAPDTMTVVELCAVLRRPRIVAGNAFSEREKTRVVIDRRLRARASVCG